MNFQSISADAMGLSRGKTNMHKASEDGQLGLFKQVQWMEDFIPSDLTAIECSKLMHKTIGSI